MLIQITVTETAPLQTAVVHCRDCQYWGSSTEVATPLLAPCSRIGSTVSSPAFISETGLPFGVGTWGQGTWPTGQAGPTAKLMTDNMFGCTLGLTK